MGRQALTSHASGKKHQALKTAGDQAAKEHEPITSHFARTTPVTGRDAHLPENSSKGRPDPSPSAATNTPGAGTGQNVASFLVKDTVFEAEILWTIKTVMEHFSCNSNEKNSRLFPRMFPDSQIAKQYSCGKTKCGYLIKFGLAPYFHKQIVSAVSKKECLYTVSFDESFNKTIQEEQMDLILRFWDEERQRVVSRYFDSEFLGHTRAADLLNKFLKGLESLDQGNMVQISMDGPSTNWKFYDELVDQRNSEDLPKLLNMGSCSLHVIHGAFKTGAQKTGWNVDSFLRSLQYLFRDAPARAEDYEKITGSNQFPLRFCSTRWLEDTAVAERAIAIWPHVDKYIKETLKGPKSNVPKIQSFSTVKDSVNDPLFPAKLQFFVTQAKLMRPYLELYQTEKPMVVFMARDLQNLVQSVMEKFVKKSVVEDLSGIRLTKVDLDKKDNLLPVRKVDVGFASKAIIEKLEKDKKASQLQLLEFFTECQTFLKSMVQKMLERSPLKYATVGYFAALDPRSMVQHAETASAKFEKLLSKLLSLRRMSAEECDSAKQQFEALLTDLKNYHVNECSDFDPKTQRLDSFFADLLSNKEQFGILWKVVKMVLILSHGQADVERGFSVNKDVVAYNMDPETLCAYRKVYDGVKQLQCEVHDIVIGKEMLVSCRASHQRYQTHMEEQKQKKKASEAEDRRKLLQQEVNDCKKKEQVLQADAARLTDKADKLCEEAETKNKMTFLVEANALRAKGKQKRKELEIAQQETAAAEKKLKLMK
jgi:hypothetical protein